PKDPQRATTRAQLKEWVGYSWLGIVGIVFCVAQIRNWRRRHERFTVTYPDSVSIEAPIGLSVLEVSRRARRPHVSVCGGRARCTTCRVRIDKSADELPPPNALETTALARIHAPVDVRLVCQLRPRNDVSFYPLLHPHLSIPSSTRLNEQLAAELAEPLSMGIGIHTGEAIIGQMGPSKTPVLTALGDAVNAAARLESAT